MSLIKTFLVLFLWTGPFWLLACQAPHDRVAEGLVRLSDVAPSIVQDMRYAGPDNFVGTRVDGYEAAACLLSKPAAQALAVAQAKAAEQGHSLIVFDCYRPQRAVDHFVRWSQDPERKTKAEYYPDLPKEDLFDLGYIAKRSGHSRGSTVDLGLIPIGESAPTRAGEGACTGAPQPPILDFGTRFDCFDTLSNTADPRISDTARANRQALLDVMTSAGFRNYAKEWWHFTLEDEPFPDTYFDAPIVTAK